MLTFPERIKLMIDRAGNAEKLAKNSGMTSTVIRKYLSEKSDPTRKKLIAMAEAVGVNVEWLATGKGPMLIGEQERIDVPFLTFLIHYFDEQQNQLEIFLSPKLKALTIAQIYDLFYEEGFIVNETTSKNIKSVLKVLISMHGLVTTEEGRERAKNLMKTFFMNTINEDESEFEANHFIDSLITVQKFLKNKE